MNSSRSSMNHAWAGVVAVLILAAAVSALSAGPAATPAAGAPAKGDLAALIDQMPKADTSGKHTGPDPETAQKVYAEVLKGGKDNVVGLVAVIAFLGQGEDYKARYLLHGIAMYVTRPDAEKDRLMVCEALASTLGGATPKAVQSLVLQELKYVGRKEAIPAAAKVLLDDELCEPAALALLAIGGTADVFRQALPAAKGKNRITIIQALGVLRDAQGSAEIRKAASDADRGVRLAALDALGNIGDAGAVDTLLAALDAKERYDRIKAAEASLVLAKRLIEADNKKDAGRIYQALWDKRTAPEDRHERIAALQGLAVVRSDINDLAAAMKAGDPQIRAVAIRMAAAMTGPDVTAKCIEAMGKASPGDRVGFLGILGARGDAAAVPAVVGAMKDSDEDVRAAAMQAASALGGPQAAEALAALVCGAAGKDREAAADALSKAKGDEASAAAGAALKKSSDPGARVPLLRVLAARRASAQVDAVMEALADKDASVRVAALRALGVLAGEPQLATVAGILKQTQDGKELAAAEEALTGACSRQLGDACAKLVAPAVAGAAPANASAMIRVLGAAGNRVAMEAILACVKNATGDVKTSAVRALGEWRSKEAIGPLLEIAQTTDNTTHKVLALRGAVRLTSVKGLSADDRLKTLNAAMKAAGRAEEKREVLAGLADVQTVEALQMAAASLDEEAVKEEAAAAVVQIAGALVKDAPDAVRDALNKVIKTTKDDRVRSNAQRVLAQIKKPK